MEEPPSGMAVDGGRGKRKQQPGEDGEPGSPAGRHAGLVVGAPWYPNQGAASAPDRRNKQGREGDGRADLPADRACEEGDAEGDAGGTQCQR